VAGSILSGGLISVIASSKFVETGEGKEVSPGPATFGSPPSLKEIFLLYVWQQNRSSELGLRQSLIFCHNFFQQIWHEWMYSVICTSLTLFGIHANASNSMNSLWGGSGVFYMFSEQWSCRPELWETAQYFWLVPLWGIFKKFLGSLFPRHSTLRALR